MPRAVARKRRHMREGQAAGGLRGACFAAPIQPGRAMDGGIRLARWLMPKRRAAVRAYAPARFRHPAARILNWQVPRGLGSSAAALLAARQRLLRRRRGGHAAEIAAQVQDLCDEAANAAGFGISEVALSGERDVSREEILALAGITGHCSLLFLDAGDDARAAVDQSVDRGRHRAQALSRAVCASRSRSAQRLRALAEGRRVSLIAADGTVLEPLAPAAFCALPLVVGQGAERRPPAISSRCSRAIRRSRDQVRASVLVAERRWNLPQERHRRAAAGIRRRSARCRRWSSSTATRSCCRATSPLSTCGCPTASGAAVGRAPPPRATPRSRRRERQGSKAKKKGGRGMTVLRFGLTPKMKPVSPRRSAIVAALDIGTSKIACLIARLEPQAPQDVLRRRSHGVRIIGFGHTAARGIKAGARDRS